MRHFASDLCGYRKPGERMPTGEIVRRADAAMADTAAGRCPFCKRALECGERCPCWDAAEGAI